MNNIDDGVISALNELTKDSDDTVRVLITCSDTSSDKLAIELMTEGAEVAQVLPELDVILVNISHRQLAFLKSSKHVCGVELDQEVNTQNGDEDPGVNNP